MPNNVKKLKGHRGDVYAILIFQKLLFSAGIVDVLCTDLACHITTHCDLLFMRFVCALFVVRI